MNNRTKRLREIQPNWELWQKLYYQYQQSYIRQKLLAIKYLWLGKSRPEVTQKVGCSYVTLTKWIDIFLKGGLLELTQQITHQVPSRLNQEQQMELKKMLLESTPINYGLDRYIWTGKIISKVIEQGWGVSLKESRIYEILSSLKLSHQKAHRDYANADKERQQESILPDALGQFSLSRRVLLLSYPSGLTTERSLSCQPRNTKSSGGKGVKSKWSICSILKSLRT